ncbi:geranylgeranyl transferase type-1 subunit beta [Recurvomyces mirabilis]|uniref:Geranylgeranyl transferase type-1 subunit beta n=1 Tax=Recurvomyces mirabilis TaxID=574656 RepID=A0AAE1C458_9PEZI|nr:geranylgeranyl transferase type-1 subunit beta [Recurvomyces mirabilis]KAK5157299.1 geranylgeranyl transferase type-1 subunit beta [Recurvomyces mirabilis]
MAILSENGASEEPRLDKARHIKYWTRCLKTLLPHQYTSNDSNRLYLAFFIISALDLLGVLESVPSKEEREDHINWIYHCQHPDGGFRMWPGTDFGVRASKDNAMWDPANIPATYFALASLLLLKDDFSRVRRRGCLEWLPRMQRGDGSFGETCVNGVVEGGMDPRFGYCATGIRFILRGTMSGPLEIEGRSVGDIDVDSFVKCVQLAEAYDGGIADLGFHEPHAGYTFCSLGALAFIDRLEVGDHAHSKRSVATAPTNPSAVISWLAYRQTELTDPDAGIDSEFTAPDDTTDNDPSQKPGVGKIAKIQQKAVTPAHQTAEHSVGISIFDLLVDGAGMSGRTNKVADTCYGFWVGASLHLMKQPTLYDHAAMRRYMLGKTQHPVLGGFGKFPGDVPDLLHGYLGLAALGLSGCEGVKVLEGGMCLSREARERLPLLWKRWDVHDEE